MTRFLFPFVSLSVAAAAALALAGCEDVRVAADDPALDANLVALGDDTTMNAPEGSLSRKVADWLTADMTDAKTFDMGVDAFVPDSDRLSPQGLGRAADLATLLQSAPDVQMKLTVSDGDKADLASARAMTLAHFLEQRGLVPGEVRLVTTTANGPANDTPPFGTLPFELRRREPAQGALPLGPK